MKFDWYGATVQAAAFEVTGPFLAHFGGRLREGKPMHSYTCAERHAERGTVLMWGGQNKGVYVQATGEDAPGVSEFLRSEFPDRHRVSRADVALDFCEPGAFARIAGIILPIVRELKMKPRFIGDPHADPDPLSGRDGWTWYFGGRTSDVQVRLYEKGLKAIGEGIDANPHWARLEVQARPRKERKTMVAKMQPREVWGLAKWSRQAFEEVTAEVVPFVPDPSLRQSDEERAFAHMVRQYSAVLGHFIDELGEVGMLEKIIEQLQEIEAGQRERADRVERFGRAA